MSERPVKRLLLCATGAFQTYATPGVVLSLLHHVAEDVEVVLSRAGARLTSKYAIEVASRHPVIVEMDESTPDTHVPHIELSRRANLILVYPASVNILGKVAHGIADELIAALILAAEVPVIFVPVTNPAMWNHPAVRRNVAILEKDGYAVTTPMPAIEVATREGPEEAVGAFPIPTLLARIRAAAAGGTGSVVRRNE